MKKNVLQAFGLTFISSMLFFLFNFFLAKYLGATVYGEVVYLLSFVQLISLFISMNYSSLYMGRAIVQQDEEVFSLFFSFHTLLFVVIALPAFFILKYFNIHTDQILLILAIAYMLVLVQTIGLEYNAKKKVVESIFLSIFIPRLLLIIVFVFMVFEGMYSATDYLYAFMISNLIVVLIIYFKLIPKWYIKKDFLYRAWKFYLLGIFGASFIYIVKILQKEYTGYEALACLSVALLFFAGLSLFGTVLVKFVLPKVHECYRDHNLKAIDVIYQNNTFLELLIISPILIILFFQMDNIVLLLGSEYKDLSTYFYILSIGYGVGFITGISGNLLRTTGHEKFEIFNEIVRFIVGLGLMVLLHSYQFGIVIALSVAMFLYNVLKYLELFVLYGFRSISLKQLSYILIYIGALIVINILINRIETLVTRGELYILFLILLYGVVFIYLKKEKTLWEGYC